MELTHPTTLISLLKKHRLYTQKSYGQNFLIDKSVLEDSINVANIQSTNTIIEIGAGAGTLTRELAKQAGRVIVFEIDQNLKPLLEETIGEFSNVELHFTDFRKVNLEQILNQPQAAEAKKQDLSASSTKTYDLKPKTYHVVANLPYNAGTHILGQLIQLPNPPQSITVLLQKEVAEKIVATAPHATYLSNFIQAYGHANVVRIVKPNSFFPPPKIHSAILHITKTQILKPKTLQTFSSLLHHGFANPRKKINKAFSIEELAEANIDPNHRPENLTFDQWVELFEIRSRE